MADRKPTKRTAAADATGGFTAEEKAAMKARVKEEKAAAGRAEGEAMALAAIAEMPEPDRTLAARIHELVRAAAPSLAARTWYGMPAYADEAGRVICFFQAAAKFKVRYATFGFQPDAALDEGTMWPTSFAVAELTAADEARVVDLVKRATGR